MPPDIKNRLVKLGDQTMHYNIADLNVEGIRSIINDRGTPSDRISMVSVQPQCAPTRFVADGESKLCLERGNVLPLDAVLTWFTRDLDRAAALIAKAREYFWRTPRAKAAHMGAMESLDVTVLQRHGGCPSLARNAQ